MLALNMPKDGGGGALGHVLSVDGITDRRWWKA